MKLLLCIAAGALLAGAQQTGSKGKTTARDMFFAGLEDSAPAAARKSKPPVTGSARRDSTPAAAPVRQSSPKPAVANTRPSAPSDLVQTVASRRPLGLRYALLKVNGASSTEVPQQTEFTSGDLIRLRIRANDSGYLYVVHEGTSGNWSVLFPQMKPVPQPNHVEAGVDIDLPSASAFRFTGKPGTERLFIVLTRTPERDLDSIIYAVQGQPETQPKVIKDAPVMMAVNRVVEGAAIDRLRTFSRDLVLEDAPAATEPESFRDVGVYVVNPRTASDARVVADIQLRHK